MDQSTKIAGLLVFLFVVFITTKGELAKYKAVFTPPAKTS